MINLVKVSRVLLALVSLSVVASNPLSKEGVSHREPHAFFTFITIAPESCDTGNTQEPEGTCYKLKDCTNLGGKAGNKCARGFGVCCYMTRTCGDTIFTNRTKFVNPKYPDNDNKPLHCTTTVDLIGDNVCQLRLDFKSFELSPPVADSGVCKTDIFRVTGSSSDSALPIICGKNNGQHLYVDVDPLGGNPKLVINLGAGDLARKWSIKVTQIECTSTQRAPTGCRQYYTEPTGTVSSFNFIPAVENDFTTGGKTGVHLANQNYRICIQPMNGFCTINWQPYDAYSFVVTGDYDNKKPGVIAEIGKPFEDAKPCVDYIVIVGASYQDESKPPKTIQADRFCGGFFPSTTTSAQPFGLHFISDGDETGENKNVGFKLKYNMLPCY